MTLTELVDRLFNNAVWSVAIIEHGERRKLAHELWVGKDFNGDSRVLFQDINRTFEWKDGENYKDLKSEYPLIGPRLESVTNRIQFYIELSLE
jgi:hypothetical protein